ncbi:MAG: hypothetical protein SF053_06165 [Bacteroidia bacterium]|nr:hypothetical protein [Bacteroidia bacterium]
MNQLHYWIQSLYHSLPVQLFLRQLRAHTFLMVVWLFLLALVMGLVGKNYGAAFLFLEPEYLGRESFWSLLIIGAALGLFLFTYMVTCYIHESQRFHFIAATQSPFYTLAYNNFILPGLFLSLYIGKFVTYHISICQGLTIEVVMRTLGLLGGILISFMISATYFFARRGLVQYYARRLEHPFKTHQKAHNKRIILEKARESLNAPQNISWYLTFPLQLNHPGEDHSRLRGIVINLNQHHGKLLLIQIGTFVFIALLGLLEGNPVFQIPAGASMLLIFSLLVSIQGAITFWYRKSSMIAVLAIVGFVALYNQLSYFSEKNQALGLDYTATPASYTRETLAALTTDSVCAADRAVMIAALESWKDRYQAQYPGEKPRAVFVCASGGGLRSAYWTFHTLQYFDSLSQGRIPDQIRLMTGASGGMFGQVYFRELYFRRKQGEKITLGAPQYREAISKDMLNRIFFKIFTDILLPHRQVQVGSHRYDKETGYTFDSQTADNLPELRGRRLGDYRQAEAAGLIPLVVLTPTVINQGRQLQVASSPISYLSRPSHITNSYQSKSHGIEFRRFFAEHQPDSLLMTTALRMNATFPIILPVIELPSQPVMEIMDAGAIDNYGVKTAMKYLFEFREWFEDNTAGIVLIQIRDNNREDPIRGSYKAGWFSRVLAPLGGGYYSVVEAKDMSNDYLMEFMTDWYKGPVEVIPIEYPRETSHTPASLSWHLTSREKQNIVTSLNTPANRKAVALIEKLYPRPLIATQPVKIP